MQFLALFYQWCSVQADWERCNFWPYFVCGAPNGPPVQADSGKVQFLAFFCQWCSKWSTCTGRQWKSAIFGPILSVVLQMVHLYRLTDKSAIFCPILSVVLQMVHLYRQTEEKCNFWPYSSSGAPNGPPVQADRGKVQFLALFCLWCSRWSTCTA